MKLDLMRETVKTHRDMIAKWMEDPEFQKEYDALEKEFSLLEEDLKKKKRDN